MYIITTGLNPSEDYIQHYGVKGMKWGVRHVKPVNHKQKLFGKAIDWEDDMTIEPGTKLYRVTPNTKEKGNYRYVTVDENDKNYYKSEWSKVLRKDAIGRGADKDKNKIQVNENEYELKEKLRMPSAKKRQAIAYKISKTDSYLNNSARLNLEEWVETDKMMTSKQAREHVKKMEKENPEQYNKWINMLKDQTTRAMNNNPPEWAAARVLAEMGGSDEIRSQFLNEVAKSGYNATIDDHGAMFKGKNQRVNAPLILIEPDKTTKQTSSSILSVEEAEAAGRQYVSDIMSISSSKSKKYFVPNVIKDYYNEYDYDSGAYRRHNYSKVHKLGIEFVNSL